jgi:hypothetical protein
MSIFTYTSAKPSGTMLYPAFCLTPFPEFNYRFADSWSVGESWCKMGVNLHPTRET